jgi:hypothetical protein
MANSVLDSLDGRDEINEMKILISGHRTIGKFTVLVEGIDDVKVYEKFFLKEKVIVYPTNGCAKLVELVDGLNKNHLESNFIGIKDADYDVLNHVSYPYPNLFMTDKHDLETMMISEETLENIMKEFLRYEDMKKERIELNVQDFLQEAIEKIRSLSYFRWYNDLSRIKLSFGTLKFCLLLINGHFVCHDTTYNIKNIFYTNTFIYNVTISLIYCRVANITNILFIFV